VRRYETNTGGWPGTRESIFATSMAIFFQLAKTLSEKNLCIKILPVICDLQRTTGTNVWLGPKCSELGEDWHQQAKSVHTLTMLEPIIVLPICAGQSVAKPVILKRLLMAPPMASPLTARIDLMQIGTAQCVAKQI
jgi:hypothetical protein